MNGKRHRRGCAIRAAARASVPGALITRTVYVVDTSVLLADPLAVTRFAEHEVVLPLVVLTELEGKRHHPELGWAARQSLRFLEELRTRHGSLLDPMPVNELGGTLRVELNHQELEALPQPLTSPANDHRGKPMVILAERGSCKGASERRVRRGVLRVHPNNRRSRLLVKVVQVAGERACRQSELRVCGQKGHQQPGRFGSLAFSFDIGARRTCGSLGRTRGILGPCFCRERGRANTLQSDAC